MVGEAVEEDEPVNERARGGESLPPPPEEEEKEEERTPAKQTLLRLPRFMPLVMLFVLLLKPCWLPRFVPVELSNRVDS